MTSPAVRRLAQRLVAQADGEPSHRAAGVPSIRQAVVQTVAVATVDVLFGGDTDNTTCGWLGMRPAVGDTVWVALISGHPLILGVQQMGWTTYTPTWTATTTNPVIGNGVLVGRYARLGSLCAVQIEMTPGSLTTFGSGSWIFALPFQATATMDQLLTGLAFDNSATSGSSVAGRIDAGGTTVLRTYTGGAPASGTVPFAWQAAANADRFMLAGVYETA